jgi:mannosylglycerate hydrolase
MTTAPSMSWICAAARVIRGVASSRTSATSATNTTIRRRKGRIAASRRQT